MEKLCTRVWVNLPHRKEKRLFTTVKEKCTSKTTDRGKGSTVISALAFSSAKANSILLEFKARIP